MNRSRARMNCFVIGKNAERERNRVRCLRAAFQTLQGRLPTVPPNTKLSKLDILILATNYITQLTKLLEGATIQESAINQHLQNKFFHPIKKWPMRKRLYSRVSGNDDGDDDDDEEEEEEVVVEREVYQKEQQIPFLEQQFEHHHYHQQQQQEVQQQIDQQSNEITSIELTNHEFNSYFDSQVQEFVTIPDKLSSSVDFLWFSTYESTL